MHITIRGEGPNLVMLHGWSMHSAVWHDLAEILANQFTLYLVDLPGHGESDWQGDDFELDRLLPSLAKALPEKAYWLGWSLGGTISLAFANRYPERVRKLILLAATPCFVQQPDWSHAMQAAIFHDFADKLVLEQTETLQRFLLLQARGSVQSRETIKALAARLATLNPAHPTALRQGLSLLIHLDMRSALSGLHCPTTLILGERDTLIPQAMLTAAIALNPSIETKLLAGAGHAPFISHAAECHQIVASFLESEK